MSGFTDALTERGQSLSSPSFAVPQRHIAV